MSIFQNLDKGKSLQNRRIVKFLKESVNSVVISPDSKYIVIGTKSGDVKVLWLETKQKAFTFAKIHDGILRKVYLFLIKTKEPAKCLVVTPDNKFAMTSAYDGSIKVFNIQEQKHVESFKKVFGNNFYLRRSFFSFVLEDIIGLVVTSKSNQLLAYSENSIKIFDLKEMKQVDELKDNCKEIEFLRVLF